MTAAFHRPRRSSRRRSDSVKVFCAAALIFGDVLVELGGGVESFVGSTRVSSLLSHTASGPSLVAFWFFSMHQQVHCVGAVVVRLLWKRREEVKLGQEDPEMAPKQSAPHLGEAAKGGDSFLRTR